MSEKSDTRSFVRYEAHSFRLASGILWTVGILALAPKNHWIATVRDNADVARIIANSAALTWATVLMVGVFAYALGFAFECTVVGRVLGFVIKRQQRRIDAASKANGFTDDVVGAILLMQAKTGLRFVTSTPLALLPFVEYYASKNVDHLRRDFIVINHVLCLILASSVALPAVLIRLSGADLGWPARSSLVIGAASTVLLLFSPGVADMVDLWFKEVVTATALIFPLPLPKPDHTDDGPADG